MDSRSTARGPPTPHRTDQGLQGGLVEPAEADLPGRPPRSAPPGRPSPGRPGDVQLRWLRTIAAIARMSVSTPFSCESRPAKTKPVTAVRRRLSVGHLDEVVDHGQPLGACRSGASRPRGTGSG